MAADDAHVASVEVVTSRERREVIARCGNPGCRSGATGGHVLMQLAFPEGEAPPIVAARATCRRCREYSIVIITMPVLDAILSLKGLTGNEGYASVPLEGPPTASGCGPRGVASDTGGDPANNDNVAPNGAGDGAIEHKA